MSNSEGREIGAIGWVDLTVDDADSLRDFYAAVTGWRPEPVDMGDYHDFNMCLRTSHRPVAGVCHARGSNAELPPVWLIYITVEDVEASSRQCLQRGGKILRAPTDMGAMGRYCIIQDPAGATAALFQFT